MASYNKIMLMGNLTRDPQMSYLPSNTPVVEFGIAVNRRYRRQDGEQGEETLFVDCRAFGRTAEVLNQYCAKGKPLFVEGRLQLDRWTDKEGNQRSKHRVFVENFQFMDAPRSGGPGGGGGQGQGHAGPAQQGDEERPARSQPARQPAARSEPLTHDPDHGYEGGHEEDIPF